MDTCNVLWIIAIKGYVSKIKHIKFIKSMWYNLFKFPSDPIITGLREGGHQVYRNTDSQGLSQSQKPG